MKKQSMIKLINDAIDALELLENERSEFETECSEKSDAWQESDRAQDATTIWEVDVQNMVDDLSDMKANLEAY